VVAVFRVCKSTIFSEETKMSLNNITLCLEITFLVCNTSRVEV